MTASITIVYNAVATDAAAAERDVLVQVEAVGDALARLGYGVATLPCTLDLEAFREALLERRPAVAFNLVEALGGHDRLAPLAAAVLDALGIPFTGSPPEALWLSSHKLLSKRHLRRAGLPTPDWLDPGASVGAAAEVYIVKAVAEHASRGLDDECLVPGGDLAGLMRHVAAQGRRLGVPCFAEAYVEGREFNLGLLEDGDGSVEVLPPAEIEFAAFPAGRPRVVGEAAKWDEDSFAYRNTPRHFDFPPADRPLLRRLESLARHCRAELGG